MGFWPAVKRLSLGVGLIVAAALVLLAADWKHRAPPSAASSAAVPAAGRMMRVALFQFASRPVLDDGMRGVTDALREAGWQEGRTVEFKRFNPESDLATADSMAKAIIGGNFDLAVTLSTPCLQVMAGANRNGRLRQVFGIVTDPFGAGVGLARGQARAARPAGLCGAGTFQPVRELFRLVHQVRPDLKTVGVVWCPGETCSRACLDLARDECAKLGITLEEATVDNANGVYEAAQALVGRGVQALWIGGDNIVELAAASVIKAADHGRIPVFTNAPVHAAAGALLNLGADYYEVGRATGRLADAVLRGQDPRDVPVENRVPRRLVVNPAVLPTLRETWRLPPAVLATAEVWRKEGGHGAAPASAGGAAEHPVAEPGRKYQLGLAYFAPEVEFDSAQRGLFDGLRDLGFVEGANLEVRRVHAQGETSNIPAMLQTLAAAPAGVIVTFTTPVLAGALAGIRGKPVVCTYVTDPLAAGAGESPERHRPNVTGVGCLPPLAETAEFFRLTFPRLRTLGTLYNPGDASSVRILADWRRVCASHGWKLEEMTMAGTSEAQQAMQALVARGVEAVYIPSDNTAYQAFGTLVKTAVTARLPLVADAPEFMQPGVLATIGVGYYHSGRATAEPLARVLRGESPAAIPIRNVTVARIRLNPDTARYLGIEFPAAVLRMQEDAAGRPQASAALPAGAAAAPPMVPGLVAAGRCWRVDFLSQVDAAMVEQTIRGFHAGLAEQGLAEGRDYTLRFQCAQGDMPTLMTLLDGANGPDTDLVVVTSTPTLQAAVKKIRGKPVVFGVVANPVKAGAGASATDHLPNVTGVSTLADFAGMREVVRELLPGCRRVGTLFVTSEANSVNNRDALAAALREAGIETVAVGVSTTNEVPDAASALMGRDLDVVCQVIGNLLESSAAPIVQAARTARKPVFAFTSEMVVMPHGAAVAVARDYEQGGRDMAVLVRRIMAGEAPGDIPFQPISKTRILVNRATAAACGLTLPAAFQRRAEFVESGDRPPSTGDRPIAPTK